MSSLSRTYVSGWSYRLAANTTADAFETLACVRTKPATTLTGLVVPLNPTAPGGNNLITVLPFGTNAANEVFEIKIISWRMISNTRTKPSGKQPAGTSNPERTDGLWTPSTMGIYTCTLGTLTGIASDPDFPDTNFLCDTIAETSSTGTPAFGAHADNISSTLTIDMLGAELAGIYFDRSTAASSNALVTTL